MKTISWRFYNLFICFVSAFYACLRPPRKRLGHEPRKVVVIHGGRMGDMVCTTPVFRALKNRYPRCQVTVVGNTINENLLAGHPDVDRYIIWQKNFWSVVHKLRGEQFDFGCVMLPSLEALALLLLGGVAVIATPKIVGGTSPYETVTYRFLIRFVIPVPHYFNHYAPREYLRLLEPLGIAAADTRKRLAYSPQVAAKVQRLLRLEGVDPKHKLLVGIVPSVGGDKLKLWAPEKFARVADYLVEAHNAQIVVIGEGGDRPEVEAVLAHLSPKTKVINLFDRLSIEELKTLVASLSLLISADTGPIYIAEAFGTPTVDILGPVNENVQPPRGKFHRVVFASRQQPMLGVLDNWPPDIREARRQSETITVEMVTRVVDELVPLIKRCRHGGA